MGRSRAIREPVAADGPAALERGRTIAPAREARPAAALSGSLNP
jgi:hypothetical protein